MERKTLFFLKNKRLNAEKKELETLTEAGESRFKKGIKEVVKSWIEANYKNISGRKGRKTDFVLPPLNAYFVKLTETSFAGALLLGYEHAKKRVIKKAEYNFADDGKKYVKADYTALEPVPFEEAVSFMKGRAPLTKQEWEEIEPKIRFRAFKMARLAEIDHIEAVKKKLTAAMERGEPFSETWTDVKQMLAEDGKEILSGYFETVYRTNMQSAYNAGRLMQYKNNRPPAWELLFIEDKRTSDVCRGLAAIAGNGKALPANHAFWNTYGFPLYHFNCRTTFRAVYDYEAKQGISIESPSMQEVRKVFKPAKGFGGNPIEKESWWKMTPAMIARADKYGITGDIIAQARELDMQSYFPELLQNYDVVHKGKKGGYVQTAKNADHDDNEIASAKRLADLGHKVYLLPRTYKAKSTDMIIDNEIGEMKRLGFNLKKSTTIETMKTEIKKAGQKQRARTLYIQIQSQKQKDRLLEIMKEEIEHLPTQTLLLDFNGSIIKYGRNFFLK